MGRNYVPGSMSFAEGFMCGGKKIGQDIFMLVDGAKAKRIVKKMLKDGRHIERAELGLDGDWRENSTTIYEDGEFHEYDAYGGSLWATPSLIIHFTDELNEKHECWKPEKNLDAQQMP